MIETEEQVIPINRGNQLGNRKFRYFFHFPLNRKVNVSSFSIRRVYSRAHKYDLNFKLELKAYPCDFWGKHNTMYVNI